VEKTTNYIIPSGVGWLGKDKDERAGAWAVFVQQGE